MILRAVKAYFGCEFFLCISIRCFVMDKVWTVPEYIATELNLDLDVSRNIVDLFETGHEIPFIARYRRHMTQNASPDDLRHVLRAYEDAKNLKAKAEKFVKKINDIDAPESKKSKIKAALMRTMDEAELESLFEPFKKTKKHTLAAAAAELGVEPLCQKILNGSSVDFSKFVNASKEGLEDVKKVEKAAFDYLSSDLHRREDTQNFLLDIISNPVKYKVSFIVQSSLSQKGLKLKKENPADFKRFELYESLHKKAELLQDHQVLAIKRGCELGYLKWRVSVSGEVVKWHPALRISVHPKLNHFIHSVVTDSLHRFFLPSIERAIKKRLLNHAEDSAIDCFACNVRELFLTAPLKGKAVLGIDPGIKHGCKCALVDKHGKLITTAVLYWSKGPKSDLFFNEDAKQILVEMVRKACCRKLVIAIGNGKENRSVQKAIASMISANAFDPTDVQFWFKLKLKLYSFVIYYIINAIQLKSEHFSVVSECGSSVYSASDVAIAEFPKLDINLRSAVSIARRVLDPISEYVKIPPESFGVGSYQHSVNAKRLKAMLDQVVKECVSNVGVDVNIASCQVLEKVAGLNKKSAANIVKYREGNGMIHSRSELQKICGIGPKTFEQCAGFLFVFLDQDFTQPLLKKKRSYTGNPLDSTPVHPESYAVAEKILNITNTTLEDIKSDSFRSKFLLFKEKFEQLGPEFILVWELLCKPVLVCNPPKLLSDAMNLSSVETGQVVEGFVVSHTQFGSFIDIGVGFNGLLHISRYRDAGAPKVNSRIRVRVENVDFNTKRIGLALA
uniref:S1 motif domain-containing protein n=1 Tax=Syphacia muris TaxID=451379 RepID=A0A0N5AQZ8_9BILA